MLKTDIFAWHETLAVCHAAEAFFADLVQERATIAGDAYLAEKAEIVRRVLHQFYEDVSDRVDGANTGRQARPMGGPSIKF